MRFLKRLWCHYAGHRYTWVRVTYSDGTERETTICRRCEHEL